MARNRKADRRFRSALDIIKENSQTIAENARHTNEKLDVMKSDIGEIKTSSTSKLPIIIAIITLLVAVSGVSVIGIWDRWKAKMDSEVKIVDDKPESEYKIYLYPEYSTFYIGMQIDMTASVNFETDAVIITAYLASGREDTVSLERKNTTEWQKKVEFTETGVHEIVVTATAPNGEVIENSIEVKVIPVGMDMDYINHYFNL